MNEGEFTKVAHAIVEADKEFKVNHPVYLFQRYGEILAKYHDTILAALSIAERGQWVKCEELLPEHGKIVALKGYNEDDSFVGFWCEKGEHWEVNNMYYNRRRFSYWHPLSPLPPEEK